MARRHVGGDVGRGVGATPRDERRRARAAAVLLGPVLLLPLAACAGEEPKTEPPDPGAPITRAPS